MDKDNVIHAEDRFRPREKPNTETDNAKSKLLSEATVSGIENMDGESIIDISEEIVQPVLTILVNAGYEAVAERISRECAEAMLRTSDRSKIQAIIDQILLETDRKLYIYVQDNLIDPAES